MIHQNRNYLNCSSRRKEAQINAECGAQKSELSQSLLTSAAAKSLFFQLRERQTLLCAQFFPLHQRRIFFTIAALWLAGGLRERADLPVEKLVPQFQRHVGELRFGIGNFPVGGDGLGDEAALLRRFAAVEKLRDAVPRLVFLRREPKVNKLPDVRM